MNWGCGKQGETPQHKGWGRVHLHPWTSGMGCKAGLQEEEELLC